MNGELWVVEERKGKGWRPVKGQSYQSEEEALEGAEELVVSRAEDGWSGSYEFRIAPYRRTARSAPGKDGATR